MQSGYWPLFRYNPRLAAQGKNPFQLDSRPPSIKLKDYIYNETRYTMLAKSNPDEAHGLLELAQQDVVTRWKIYEHMANMPTKEATIMIDLSKTIDLDHHLSGIEAEESAGGLFLAHVRGRWRTSAAWKTRAPRPWFCTSLFEEQIDVESDELDRFLSAGESVSAESTTHFPDMLGYNRGPEAYLKHIRKAKEAVHIPVIASLNGTSVGGWLHYAETDAAGRRGRAGVEHLLHPGRPRGSPASRWSGNTATWCAR